jgi:hypothetical protein
MKTRAIWWLVAAAACAGCDDASSDTADPPADQGPVRPSDDGPRSGGDPLGDEDPDLAPHAGADASASDEIDSDAGAGSEPDPPSPGSDAASDGVGPVADAAVPAAAPDADVPAGPAGTTTFRRHTVDDAASGPAYAEIADLDGDGQVELVVAHLGVFGFAVPEGQITVHTPGATLAEWSKSTLVPPDAGVRFPGQPTAADIDGDGDLDLIVPSGFLVCIVIPGGAPCGGLGWYEQTADGWHRHDVVPNGATLFYHHAEWVDFDGDGVHDLVTVGEEKQAGFGETPERSEVQWFRGTAEGARFETTPRVIGPGLGSFPRVRDIDGDGDLDIAGAEFFDSDASFAWYERTADPSPDSPAGVFTRHVIDADSGPSIMFTFVDDLFGDGLTRALGSNHTNTEKVPPDPWDEALFAFDIPQDPRQPWPKTVLTDAFTPAVNLFAPQAAPGIFEAGDLDGDLDLDIVISGDGDPKVLWLEQTSPGVFETHVLAEGLGQAGGARIADLNGDGRNEIVVTTYDGNAVYVFERH